MSRTGIGSQTNRSSGISQVLRALHGDVEQGLPKWNFHDENEKNYRIFVATCRSDRERAYRLARRVYATRGYVPDTAGGMIVTPFDAHPETFTLLVEDESGREAGTITLNFDSVAGLPCDEIFTAELEMLRAQGRRLVEVTRLAIDSDLARGREMLVRLFNFIYVYARRVRGKDDFVIEVNPRHVVYYRQLLGFEPVGESRPCPRVQGAPAVLLRLNLEFPEAEVRRVAGRHDGIPTRSLYPCFCSESAEPRIAGFLARTHASISEEDARYFELLSEAREIARSASVN